MTKRKKRHEISDADLSVLAKSTAFIDTSRLLLRATEEEPADMHQTDDTVIVVRVVGTNLDNSVGSSLDAAHLIDGRQEMLLIVDGGPGMVVLNMASVIALARVGATQVMKKVGGQ